MMTNRSSSAEPAEVISHPESVGQKRKGRGPTRGISIQKKRKDHANKKLEVLIPLDQTVAVGLGANDFVTELLVKVLQFARHDVEKWKKVSDEAKKRIVDHMLDTFDIPNTEHNKITILLKANALYRLRRSRLHIHFKKFATKEESLQNMPEELDETEWKFLVDYFSSDDFKEMSERNKRNKAKQELNHVCGRKSFQAVSYEERDPITRKEPNSQKLWEKTHIKENGHWVNDAFAEVNDKVNELVVQQIEGLEEGTDIDPIVDAAFVKVAGETAGCCRGQGARVKKASKRSMHGIQEQLQKKVEEERQKRETVESKLIDVQNQLDEERKNREVMEAHLVQEQKNLKESFTALASLMKISQIGLPAALLNIFSNSSGSNEANPTSLLNVTMGKHA